MTGWNHNTPLELALAAAADLEAELHRLPPVAEGESFEARMAARDRYQAALGDLAVRLKQGTRYRPTTIVQDGAGGGFALLGFRATSTMGLAGAIRNWISQVRAKAGAR